MKEKKDKNIRVSIKEVSQAQQLYYSDDDVAIVAIDEKLQALPPVRLDMVLLMGCFRGSFRICVNQEPVEVRRGQVLWCKLNDVLSGYEPGEECEGQVLCLSERSILDHVWVDGRMLRKVFRMAHTPLLTMTEQEIGLLRAYGEVMSLRARMPQRTYGKEVVHLLVQALLLELMASLMVGEEANEPLGQKDYLFQRFMRLLVEQEVKQRTVEWYGHELCVTPKYLSSVCRQVSGRTAFEWINQFVLADIRYQLKYTSRTIQEVADYLDFPNASFFGKYVRQHVGCPPKEYRLRLRQAD